MQAIDKEIALAHRLADAAGEISSGYFRTSLNVENKSDLSPVTEADRECESAMRTLIEETFPDHGIVGEEFGKVRGESPYQWVLDPIDGTRAFIAGQPTFTTLIALAKDGVPILGVIDQPVKKERWVGIAGTPTALNGKPAATRICKILAQATIATTSTDYFTPAQAQAFDKLKQQCSALTLGGDAYLYAQLASGKMDMVVDAGLKPYDFCALVPVVEGAGGIITDWAGKPVTLASDGAIIAAANKELHRQALTWLRQAVA